MLAHFLLGKAYHEGKLVGKDLEAAERHYGIAARQGHAGANNNLGLIVLKTHHDPEAAILLFKKAIELGNTRQAYFNLGQALDSEGMTVMDAPDRWVEACANYEKAYAGGFGVDAFEAAVKACVKAALAPRKEHLGKDAIAALRTRVLSFAAQAEALPSPRALQNIGALYYYEKDYAAALPWISKAAALGEPTAAYTLGLMHAQEKGVPGDHEQALAWFMRAAQAGHAPAAQEAVTLIRPALYSSSVEELSAALAQLRTIQASVAEDLYLDDTIRTLKTRLHHLQAYAAYQAAFQPLPRGPIEVAVCLTDGTYRGTPGIPLSNMAWKIYGAQGDPGIPAGKDFLAEGRTNAKGCVVVTGKQQARLRAALDQKLWLVLSYPGQKRLLKAEAQQKRVRLVLQELPDWDKQAGQ